MTTLSVTDSTADLIETLTIAVAAVRILDDETRSKHAPRMERLLCAVQEPGVPQPTAALVAALDRWKNAVRADRNRAHQDPDRRRAVTEATSALEDAYDAYVATPTTPDATPEGDRS